MTENWVIAAKRADFNAIGQKFGIDPVIARLIRNRDVVGDENIEKYLHGTLDDLYDPAEMKDLVKASEILSDYISNNKKIRIIGDYDIDGIMSSYILVKGLGRLGADADVRIPDRMTDGYGLNERLIREAKDDGRELIITCDNGIAASSEIALANELGMKVIVTDHHEIPYETEIDENGGETRKYHLPPAEAVVDPKQPDCGYPYKGLCGAGVVFKLISFMYSMHGVPEAEAEELLEYTAFATIGDVMELTDENRIIVREGIRRLRKTGNAGLRQLILLNNLDPERIDVYHIGFVLGPCMNASGRLNTAMHALSMLMAETEQEAAAKAGDLIALNASRKDMTLRGEEQAVEILETTDAGRDRVLVVYLPDIHESIAGIIAGRIKEKYHKPVFVLTDSRDGVKGSGRSIESYDMYDELCRVKECFTKFGGHKMAAGVSMNSGEVDVFREKINANCKLTREDMIPKVVIDVAMPIGYISEKLIEQINIMQPFGVANTRPVFAESKVNVLYPKVIGKNRNAVRMVVKNRHGHQIEAIYLGEGDEFVDYVSSRREISIIYYPEINTFRGAGTLQIQIRKYR